MENAKIELELAKRNNPRNIGLYDKLSIKLINSLREAKEAEKDYHLIVDKYTPNRKEYLEMYNSNIGKLLKHEEEITSFIKNSLKSYILYQANKLKLQNESIDQILKVLFYIMFIEIWRKCKL